VMFAAALAASASRSSIASRWRPRQVAPKSNISFSGKLWVDVPRTRVCTTQTVRWITSRAASRRISQLASNACGNYLGRLTLR
jgi:hypothetical protein